MYYYVFKVYIHGGVAVTIPLLRFNWTELSCIRICVCVCVIEIQRVQWKSVHFQMLIDISILFPTWLRCDAISNPVNYIWMNWRFEYFFEFVAFPLFELQNLYTSNDDQCNFIAFFTIADDHTIQFTCGEAEWKFDKLLSRYTMERWLFTHLNLIQIFYLNYFEYLFSTFDILVLFFFL